MRKNDSKNDLTEIQFMKRGQLNPIDAIAIGPIDGECMEAAR